MNNKYILALDQGTSSSRAIVFDHEGNICSVAQQEFTQHFPKPGWVEHDPMEIWSSEAAVIAQAITKMGVSGKDLAAIGITNQRETTIVWDAETGVPVYNAIVWQDRRTSAFCDAMKEQGLVDKIRERRALSSTPTSPEPRSSGSWTTYPEPGKRPMPANCASAPWTVGWCGSLPAARCT